MKILRIYLGLISASGYGHTSSFDNCVNQFPSRMQLNLKFINMFINHNAF